MAANWTGIGSLLAIWRYPVKSMMGEELSAVPVLGRGLLGDRARAMIDGNGQVATMKNPRRWPNLLEFQAQYVEIPAPGVDLPAVRITLPDGREIRSDDRDADSALSSAVGNPVRLQSREPVELDQGAFFDCAMVHLLTTATLNRLGEINPAARFDSRRFRPNLVIETSAAASGFVENDWIGKTLFVGDDVRLDIIGPCPRCVMTTLAQNGLPADNSVLRTAARHNQANVGVYASVSRVGTLRRGDPVRLR